MPKNTVTIVTDTGSHEVEIGAGGMTIWGALDAIQKANPDLQVRYMGPTDQTGRGYTAQQARETYVQPGGRITQTPKNINAAS